MEYWHLAQTDLLDDFFLYFMFLILILVNFESSQTSITSWNNAEPQNSNTVNYGLAEPLEGCLQRSTCREAHPHKKW